MEQETEKYTDCMQINKEFQDWIGNGMPELAKYGVIKSKDCERGLG